MKGDPVRIVIRRVLWFGKLFQWAWAFWRLAIHSGIIWNCIDPSLHGDALRDDFERRILESPMRYEYLRVEAMKEKLKAEW